MLPEAYARLQLATSDVDRERLTALRYRLVATDSLNWPGGLERLAATDFETRQQAADELAVRATTNRCCWNCSADAQKLSPEQQELLEEMQGDIGYYGGGGNQPKPGEPVFALTSPIAEADHEQALTEAFGKAKAARLAKAAGVELGELRSLRFGALFGGAGCPRVRLAGR